MQSQEVLGIVERYLQRYPAERSRLHLLVRQLEANEKLDNRKNFTGHITGGAIVLSPQRDKVLVIHHKIFDKWLQPGGHWDPGESSPWAAARREAEEETGIQIVRQLPVVDDDFTMPIDIESHPIAARSEKHEPVHIHHDFRYVFLAANEQLHPRTFEVHDAIWMLFDDPRLEHIHGTLNKLQQLM